MKEDRYNYNLQARTISDCVSDCDLDVSCCASADGKVECHSLPVLDVYVLRSCAWPHRVRVQVKMGQGEVCLFLFNLDISGSDKVSLTTLPPKVLGILDVLMQFCTFCDS